MQASLYPSDMHNRISDALTLRNKETHEQYICYHDNLGQQEVAHLSNLPTNTISIRTDMHFPEGPLYHDAPRPDSTQNEFCLSCHVTSAKGGLTLEALRYMPGLEAKHDPRRQPSQPPARIFGNIPSSFIDSLQGEGHAQNSSYIDEYLMPSIHD